MLTIVVGIPCVVLRLDRDLNEETSADARATYLSLAGMAVEANFWFVMYLITAVGENAVVASVVISVYEGMIMSVISPVFESWQPSHGRIPRRAA